jgi:hypothetical protein
METQGVSLGSLSSSVFAFAEYLAAFFMKHIVGDKSAIPGRV